MFFHEVPEGAPDAVFGMAGAFAADTRSPKVDLLVGIYKNNQLQSELMPSIARAKAEILSEDLLADYLPIDGSPELIGALGELLFGETLWHAAHSRIYGAQTVGGTSALRIGADFLVQEISKIIYIPQPTWPNHRVIFERAGFSVETYPYYSHLSHGFDCKAMLDFLGKLGPKSIVLLHGCCHNPTGCDPTIEEWAEIARFMRKAKLVPFFDCAYQGLGDGIEQDAEAIRHFTRDGLECLVAYSCSKNFSLYCQRVGALFIVDENAAVKLRVGSQIKRIIRALYSNPPAHGGRIVSHVLKGALRAEWEKDLRQVRERIRSMRHEFVRRLMVRAKKTDFRPLLQHSGMFSFIDLEKPQVQRLIENYAIYMLDNGRISIAGLNEKNLDYVVDSLLAVTE